MFQIMIESLIEESDPGDEIAS